MIYIHKKNKFYRFLMYARNADNAEDIDAVYKSLYKTEDFPRGQIWRRNLYLWQTRYRRLTIGEHFLYYIGLKSLITYEKEDGKERSNN